MAIVPGVASAIEEPKEDDDDDDDGDDEQNSFASNWFC